MGAGWRRDGGGTEGGSEVGRRWDGGGSEVGRTRIRIASYSIPARGARRTAHVKIPYQELVARVLP